MSKEKQIFLPVEDKKEIIKSFKTTNPASQDKDR